VAREVLFDRPSVVTAGLVEANREAVDDAVALGNAVDERDYGLRMLVISRWVVRLATSGQPSASRSAAWSPARCAN
jgi:hypothetical protein